MDRSGEILAVVSRVADSILELRKEFTDFTAGIQLELHILKERIDALEKGRLPPMRSAESSWHDMDVELQRLRDSMKKRVKDPADPLDLKQARELVTTVNIEIDRGRELNTWRGIKKGVRRIGWYVVAGLIAAATMAYVAGHFEGRSTATQSR